MKLRLMFLSLVVVVAANFRVANAETVYLGVGGSIHFDELPFRIRGLYFTKEWHTSQVGDSEHPLIDGSCNFFLHRSREGYVDGVVKLSSVDKHTVKVVYTFTPREDISARSLYVGFQLPVSDLQGARWSTESTDGVFPDKFEVMSLLSGSVGEMGVRFADSSDLSSFRFKFMTPTSVLIQDNRRFNSDSIAFRFYLPKSGELHAGESHSLEFEMSLSSQLEIEYPEHYELESSDKWVPLSYEKDIVAGSALDFSGMGFVDAPAGKYGWLKSVGSSFEFEQRPGVAQRFYGINLCSSANFPTHEEAVILAERLLRLGYNSVRIHHHDNGCVRNSKDSLTLDTEYMERLDFFLAECYKRGLYATTDLYVSRRINWRHIGIDRDGVMDSQQFKGLVMVYEPAYQNWAAFVRNFMHHKNPYTGRRYADDPGMPMIALINEGSLAYFSETVVELPQMQEAWQSWLKAKRAQEPAFNEVPDKMSLYTSGVGGAAVALFVADVEKHNTERMIKYLRDELGVKALLSNYNTGRRYVTMQPVRERFYDYVDDHFYVGHPRFLKERWRLPSMASNQNPLFEEAHHFCSAAYSRLTTKPYVITEYNYAAPSRFRSIAGLLTGSLGGLQSWAGMWRFAYSHNIKNIGDEAGGHSYFDMSLDPLMQATERAVMMLFMRGDMAAAANKVAIGVTEQECGVLRNKAQLVTPEWAAAAWHTQVATHTSRDQALPEGWQVISYDEAYSDTSGGVPAKIGGVSQESPLVIDKGRGAFRVVTARTAGGFAESGVLQAGPLSFMVQGAAATIWASSLDDKRLESSGRILLTHLTDVQRSRSELYDSRVARIVYSGGGLPYLAQAGSASVALHLDKPESYKVYALATSGKRIREVESRVEGGALVFRAVVGVEEGCNLYEIVRGEV